MRIIEAIKDENLFRPFLADRNDSLLSWTNWFTALRLVYGMRLPPSTHDLIRQCTGRDPSLMPANGFNTALFLTGRRSGKSRIAAVIGAFEALFGGHEKKLARGEKGLVPVLAPTVKQSRIVKGYLRAIFKVPLLANELVEETKEGFELRNGTRIEILAGDYRTCRGFSLCAAICDELAFFGLEEEFKTRSDTELIRAIKPSLATLGGKLICISSPYARKGYCFKTYDKNFGNDAGRVLVWNCSSRTMNPTLPQSVVDDAMAEDLQAAKSEYGGEFRDDVAEFLPREVIERLVIPNRLELLPRDKVDYFAFADLSGGRSDDAALAIAHREGRMVVVDALKRYRPPFNPHVTITKMTEVLKQYRVRRVIGDNYAAAFCETSFQSNGVAYTKSDLPKSALYGELLPRLCSGEIELLDDKLLINQLASLERRTRSGGKDIIDHPAGSHDDLANVVAGVSFITAKPRLRLGALFRDSTGGQLL